MSGQNYIGSKISLISLSDIRYVGILHSINPVESTVALQNVQSHGTEGRKDNPNEEIRPTDNTFDYVVFRGSDIKDLQVFEAPPSFQSEQPQPQFIEPVVNAAPYTYSLSTAAAYYSTPPMFSSNMNRNTDYPYGNTPHYWQSNHGNVAASSESLYNPYIVPQQQTHYPMPVPEIYQPAVLSAPPAAAAVAINDLNIHKDGDSTPSSEKAYKEEEEEKTVASPKKEVPAVSSTFASMQTTKLMSQEKLEVAPVIEQVDEVILHSLVKQVSDLDIKRKPATVLTQKSPNRPQMQQQPQQQQPQQQQQEQQEQQEQREQREQQQQKHEQREQHQQKQKQKQREQYQQKQKQIQEQKQQQQQQQHQSQTSDPINRVDGSNGSHTNPRGKRNRNSNRNKSTRSNENGNGNENAREANNINHHPKSTTSNARRNSSGIVIPKSDFDFESSNAKFDKNGSNHAEDLGGSNEEHVVIPEADHFYDKNKSFFDDISCESKEYQKGNRGGKYKEESKLNLETFGQTNPAGQTGKRSRHRGSRGRPSRVNRDKPSSNDPRNHETKEKSN